MAKDGTNRGGIGTGAGRKKKPLADKILEGNPGKRQLKIEDFEAPDLIERYAVSSARWIQCEEAVSQYGFLAKHPTTGNAMQSPYVSMSVNYMSQTSRIWTEIYQIVKDNCTGEFRGVTQQDDVMERLLTIRK